LATVAAPSPSSQARAAYPAAGTTTTTDDWTVPAHRSASDWSDRETGLMAAAVVGALGLVFLLIIVGVVLYASTWGYSVTLG
jgi:hypothetical protein